MPEEPRIERIYAAFFETAFPGDLALVLAWLMGTVLAVLLPVVSESPVRFIFALPALLFLPGYSLLGALFPRADDIDLLERAALSVGLSVAVVPLIGLGLNYTPLGIRLLPLLVAVSLFILVMVALAHYRRARCKPEERFAVPFPAMVAQVKEEFPLRKGTRTERLLNALLLVAIIGAVITTVLVIALPKPGEYYTEFYLLGSNRMMADYPDQVRVGSAYPLYIGIVNHEYRPVTYTIETYGTTFVTDNSTNETSLIAMEPLWQQSLTLAHNETVLIPYSLSVNKSGYNRIEFLLFNATVPGPEVTGGDRIAASYRDLHLWVNVTQH